MLNFKIKHKTKIFIKKIGIWCLSTIGPRLPKESHQDWLCRIICPFILDKKILKPGLTERPLNNLSALILCNPYDYVHWAPYWCRRLHEYKIEKYLRHELKTGDTFIDVGCHVGQITILAACLVGHTGHVYSFEANKDLAAMVEKHCYRQKLQQVTVYPIGLGKKKGPATFYIDTKHTGHSTFRPFIANESKNAHIKSVIVNIQKGDDILHSDKQFTGRTFLKIDVEGYELEVLEGLRRILSNYVTDAIIEITPKWIGREAVASIFSLMDHYGFIAYTLNEAGQIAASLKPETVKKQQTILFRKNKTKTFVT